MNLSHADNKMDQSRQQYTVSFMDYPWSSPQDIYDYFDLRYLFDEDEILEYKRQLIEDEGKIFWHTYDDEDEYFNAEGPEPAVVMEVNMEVDEENWDEDEDWGVRFQHGIGFYHDGYDSGYDEPYSRREPYPDIDL